MPKGPILIAAFSGRALAEAARRSGYAPYVADLFCDEDTIAASRACRRVAGDLERGFDPEALLAALAELSDIAPPARRSIGTVYGSGFEANPSLLARIDERWPVIGNRLEIVRLVKNPFFFQEACRALDITHPETARTLTQDGRRWLQKLIGGAGGSHVSRAGCAPSRIGYYYQQEVTGRSISALFIADGQSAPGIIGLSEQWTAPVPDQQFRYGGAAQPASVSNEHMALIESFIGKVTEYFALRGLNSADFILNETGCALLEINPRPGATLEMFDDDHNRLFAQHADAAEGLSISPGYFRSCSASASAVVYADAGDLTATAMNRLPEWLKDRPQPGSKILRNQPLCTVLAKGNTLSESKRVCAERGLFAQALYYNK